MLLSLKFFLLSFHSAVFMLWSGLGTKSLGLGLGTIMLRIKMSVLVKISTAENVSWTQLSAAKGPLIRATQTKDVICVFLGQTLETFGVISTRLKKTKAQFFFFFIDILMQKYYVKYEGVLSVT